MKKTNDEITSISKRLDAIISILLNQSRVDSENMKEKIARLIKLGFENQEIADILNTTLGLVIKERSLLKKVNKK